VTDSPAAEDAWIAALVDRHVAPLRRSEFLKAVRALSARYVERHDDLPGRSALDSAGKRAAFGAFYAPLHFLTVREIVRALTPSPGSAAAPPTAPQPSMSARSEHRIDTLIDLGCGTGACGAAWALALPHRPTLRGFDVHPWAVAETNWNWRTLGLRGRAAAGDLVRETERLVAAGGRQPLAHTAVIYGWSVNELDRATRDRLRPSILALGRLGARVLVVEPIAQSLVPWWQDWARAFAGAGGRADLWKFDTPLPAPLRDLDAEAGFQREGLGARTCALNMGSFDKDG